MHKRHVGVVSITVTFMVAFTVPRSLAQSGLSLRNSFDTSNSGTPPGNRPGPGISRTSPSSNSRPDIQETAKPDQLLSPRTIGDFSPKHGLENPSNFKAELGASEPTAWSLQAAMDQMIKGSHDIGAARSEIEQARADIVTAGLRSNPLFYADMQQVPYRIMGPHQADVNFAYPLDVSGKRRTRIKSASCAYRAIEWKYADFIRIQKDNLQTVFIDTLTAQELAKDLDRAKGATSTKSNYVKMDRDTAEKKRDDEKNKPTPDPTELAKLEIELKNKETALGYASEEAWLAAQSAGDAKSQWRDQRNALALLFNHPEPASIRLRGWIDDPRTYPNPDDSKIEAEKKLAGLIQIALANRPDFQSQRWNLCRALADVEAVKAAKWDDVSFLVQPYTYLPGFPNSTAWAFGVTVPLPVYNKQQGNLVKAQHIVSQTRDVLSSLEATIKAEVVAAYNEVCDTASDTDRFKRVMNKNQYLVPDYYLTGLSRQIAARRPRPTPKDAIEESLFKTESYLVKIDPLLRRYASEQMDKDRAVFLNTLIKHRKAVLRMNTVTGTTISSDSPFYPDATGFGPVEDTPKP